MLRRLAIPLLALLLMPAPGAFAQTGDPAAVIRAFYEASNAGNVEAAIAQIAPDAVFTFAVDNPARPEGVRFVGAEGLRQRFQIQASENVVDEISGLRVLGNRVTWTDLHTNNAFRRLSVAPLEFRGEGVIENGKITSLTTRFTPGAIARLQTAQASTQSGQPARAPAQLPRTGEGDDPLLGLLAISAGLLVLGLGLHRARVLRRS